MKDEIVLLVTAMLAKEKGFNEPTIWYYHPNYGLSANSFHESDEMENMNSGDWAVGYYSAPTQTLLQRWLRENHNIYVIVELDQTSCPKFCYSINKYDDQEWEQGSEFAYSDLFWAHEDALEAGLITALKLIKL